MVNAEIKRHWSRVAGLGCMISKAPNPTLHHCHGGSMLDRGVRKALGRKTSDWLVIPLAARYHTGEFGIDSGQFSVREWELRFCEQAEMLDRVCAELGVDVWAMAHRGAQRIANATSQ